MRKIWWATCHGTALSDTLVIDERHGELGKITDVDETTINVLLQIDHHGNELLLPAVEELITAADHEKQNTAGIRSPKVCLIYNNVN